MIRILFILYTCLSISIVSFSQQGKKYERTLKDLIAALRKEPTVPLQFHETSIYPANEIFYDGIINTYFNKEILMSRFSKDTAVFAVAGKMDILRHQLNQYDKLFDEVSLVIRKTDDKTKREFHSQLQLNKIENGKEEPFMICEFDPSTYKLLSLRLTPGSDKSYHTLHQ